MILLYITIASLSIILLFGLFVAIHKWLQLKPYNQKPLYIKTFDGSDSPYHPSVLYFKDSWNGYKYWMAETPYSPLCKPYQDRNECPSIHVSNDGINWSEISNNPIDNLNKKEVKELDYFSDPHLVYVNGVLECWYRLTRRKGISNNHKHTLLLRKRSKDGVNWSEREILTEITEHKKNLLGDAIFSPAIIYKNGTYRMWYVNSDYPPCRDICYSESIDGYIWNQPTTCILESRGNRPWHIDVKYIDKKYYLVNYNLYDISIWDGHDGINFKFKKQLLTPSITGSFYGYKLYRACIVKDDNEYKVYFSGNDFIHTYIGLMGGKDIDSLNFIIDGKHLSFIGFIYHLIKLKAFSANFIIDRISKTIKKVLSHKN